MDGPASTRRADPLGMGSIAQFLSLYLLLLAFFIVLNSLSTFETVRAGAVMESLSTTFQGQGVPGAVSTFTGTEGSVVADARAFQREITDIFQTELPVAEIRVTEPGRSMEAEFRADALFDDGAVEMRRPHWRLADRLAAALTSAPAGLAYEMEFRHGSDYDSIRTRAGDSLAGADVLPAARGAAFARFMVGRGTPPRSLGVGIEAGRSDRVRLVFRLIDPTVGQSAGEGEQ